ncbi:MAG TPA: hypothetical protein VMF59_09660 [Bacteroidota bacterium]|nr:hypothetical protein [Bacteroidota bacterium]
MGARKGQQEIPEFRLVVSPAVNERTGKPTTLVVLQTTKSFSTFRYALAVDDRVADGTLRLKVLGLRTPSLDLPATGPAEFRKEYAELAGDVTFDVEGLDGSHSSVVTHINPGRVTLTSGVRGRPIEVDIPSANRSQNGTPDDPRPL